MFETHGISRNCAAILHELVRFHMKNTGIKKITFQSGF